MPAEHPVVVIEALAPGVRLVRINRPAARNALNMAVREALSRAFQDLSADPDVRVIVTTGDAQAFAAGADLTEFVDMSAVDQIHRAIWKLWAAVKDCPKPVIAAVNGFALGGGCEYALMADIIVAGETASFGQPEVRVGIMPGAGGTQRLLRALGKYQAMKMLLTGEPISGREAFAAGLASECVPDAEVLPRALELAGKIARMPPLAVQQIKETVLAGEGASLESALVLERKAFQLLFATADQTEGMRAFLDKRKPVFEGR
jgi:enoyl-CoA hydratase/carnithine racemase